MKLVIHVVLSKKQQSDGNENDEELFIALKLRLGSRSKAVFGDAFGVLISPSDTPQQRFLFAPLESQKLRATLENAGALIFWKFCFSGTELKLSVF